MQDRTYPRDVERLKHKLHARSPLCMVPRVLAILRLFVENVSVALVLSL